MNWEYAAKTDRGRRRGSNEDAFVARPDVGLFVVADGMGGHAAGEVASQMAVDVLAEEYLAAGSTALAPGDLEAMLVRGVNGANRAIFERGEREPDKSGMGTTLTVLVLLEEQEEFRVAHVGDSRAYLWRDGELAQLTMDHTWVQQRVLLGELTPAEARRHPFANVVTRALGIGEELEVDLVRGTTLPGDVFLVCSDGLSGMLRDRVIRDVLGSDASAEEMADRLIGGANKAGGHDNITAVLVRVLE